MQELYRTDYEGEYVVVGVKVVNGKKQQEREFVDNPLQIESVSGRAVCVSDGASSKAFNLKMLATRHGLLDSLAIHNYATGNMYQQFTPNFHITFNTEYLDDLVDRGLTEDIMVYTSTTQCLRTPGEFFIIPYGIKMTEEGVAAYLAAFDGHNEVYLLGYDEYSEDGKTRRSKVINATESVIQAYPGVKFIQVIDNGKMPEEWYRYRNVKTITTAEFRSQCDISTGQWLR